MAFSALEALQAFGAGRAMAMQDKEIRRRETLTDGLLQAYDPNAGGFNAPAARQAYMQAGDIGGLQQFDQQHQQGQAASLEAHRARIVQGARFLEGVSDQTSYDAARRSARDFGIDLTDVPDVYDPNYIEGLRRAAQTFAPQASGNPTEFQRNYEYLQRTNPTAASDYLARQTESQPVVFDVNGDGAPDLVPRSYFNQQPAPQNTADLRKAADEAIAAGADPAAVEARLRQMSGGTASNGSGGF